MFKVENIKPNDLDNIVNDDDMIDVYTYHNGNNTNIIIVNFTIPYIKVINDYFAKHVEYLIEKEDAKEILDSIEKEVDFKSAIYNELHELGYMDIDLI